MVHVLQLLIIRFLFLSLFSSYLMYAIWSLFLTFFMYKNFIFIIESVVTCILSGYLYAVGGHDGIIYLKTVERYNPIINEWTYVASMGARRGGVGVATLGGCLYATGGYDGTSNLSTSGLS